MRDVTLAASICTAAEWSSVYSGKVSEATAAEAATSTISILSVTAGSSGFSIRLFKKSSETGASVSTEGVCFAAADHPAASSSASSSTTTSSCDFNSANRRPLLMLNSSISVDDSEPEPSWIRFSRIERITFTSSSSSSDDEVSIFDKGASKTDNEVLVTLVVEVEALGRRFEKPKMGSNWFPSRNVAIRKARRMIIIMIIMVHYVASSIIVLLFFLGD
mmetsp:Transcript_6927/g.14719  ORF Transcript_6927/g.14719 Transcript_6927/m.14719 type:complete len:219 (-) Transcript_6927:190-846(-)